MLQGETLSVGSDQLERAAVRALRLYQHAKYLASNHHDAAAELRYRAAAELAAANHRSKLAAHAMTRLSYFLTLRGRHEEALNATQEALNHTEDPLAVLLQVRLRRRLGELKTDAELSLAEEQLGEIVGQLPSETLE